MAETKVALITGANKGIGLETARQLGNSGYTILLGARDFSKGKHAAEQLRSDGIDVRAVKLDVTSEPDREAITALIAKEHGKLDVLVNNAGRNTGKGFGPNETSKTDLQTLRDVFETNFFAVVALTNALLPLLEKSPAPRIVNVSSILGSVTYAGTKGSPTYDFKAFEYNTSKAALNMFTIHLAHELAKTKIKVNSAHPGWVKTDMGGDNAPMEIVDGAKTEIQLATLGDDGPTGGYFHDGQAIAW